MSEPDGSRPAGSPIRGWFADPHIGIVDGRYLVYATTDGSADWSSTGFHAFTSTDLVEWTDHGVVFDVRDSGWASGHAWAPTHAEVGGRHYLYYTADTGSIGVAVAATPFGPFADLGRPLVADGEYEGTTIDPSVFVDEAQPGGPRVYLLWGNTIAYIVPLAADLMSFDPAHVVAVHPEEFREAATIHRRGDVYYLSWSVDDTRSVDYRVHYATGPSALGPWQHRGVLLSKDESRGIVATGHHSIVGLPGTDEWIIAYHRFAIPGGDGYHRELRFDALLHDAEGLLEPVRMSTAPFRRRLGG